MRDRLRKQLSYSNVMATVAVFLAMGGGAAYAANTVFSSDIRNGEVRTADLANGAVTAAKIAGNAIRSGKVVNDSLTGVDVREGTLGAVPAAQNALNAGNSDTVDGRHAAQLDDIATVVDLSGTVHANIPADPSVWQFAGFAPTVTTSTGDVVVASATAHLGADPGTTADTSICAQNVTDSSAPGPVEELSNGDDYLGTVAVPSTGAYSATVTGSPGAGTFKVGFCVRTDGGGALNDNDWMQGYAQVIPAAASGGTARSSGSTAERSR